MSIGMNDITENDADLIEMSCVSITELTIEMN